jgi:hypothetical protein
MALLIGLDGEMSDSELAKGAVLIQIGVCDDYGNTFESLIGHAPGWYQTEQASAVHRIPDESIIDAPPPDEVDQRLKRWLESRLDDARIRGEHAGLRPFIPVGWNVGGFDMPFVRAFLPESSSIISRRSLDLNALCYAFEDARVTYQGERKSYSQWRRLAHDYVDSVLDGSNWHDALFDAQAALEAYNFLTGVFTFADYSPPQR